MTINTHTLDFAAIDRAIMRNDERDFDAEAIREIERRLIETGATAEGDPPMDVCEFMSLV